MYGDILFFFEPAKSLLHESLRSGRLPLWSPWIFAGYPIAAEGQTAVFYPLSLLISWLLPSPAAINWLVISHLLIATVSMYALARLLGASLFAAWLAAMVFAFSGFLFAHIHHVSLLCAAAWLPLVVFFIERAWRGAVIPNAVLAALAWGLAALCGHPQMLFFISLVAIFWVAWRWLESRGERARAIAIIAVVFGLGFALGSVQLLMTAQLASLAPHGERGELSYITSFSLLPRHLFGLLSPNWEGTLAFDSYRGDAYHWEYVLYIGLIPLGLAVNRCDPQAGPGVDHPGDRRAGAGDGCGQPAVRAIALPARVLRLPRSGAVRGDLHFRGGAAGCTRVGMNSRS